MARPLRIDYPGAWHHVMNRGARHQEIFLSDEDRHDFLDLLGTIHERFGLELNAFCLMSTHYHLLVRNPEGELTRAVHYLDSVYAQRFNRRNRFDGPLFRGRFRSKLVDSDGYCHLAARYIHRNPLEAGLTSRLLDYKWSSYPIFMQQLQPRPSWLYRNALDIGGLHTAVQLERETEGPPSSGSSDVFDSPDVVIGSDEFVKAALKTAAFNHETCGQSKETQPSTSVTELDLTISRELNVDLSSLHVAHRGIRNRERLIAVGLAQRICRQSLQEIALRYGFATPKSAGSATARFRQRMSERSFAIEVERIVALCEKGESEARPRQGEGGK